MPRLSTIAAAGLLYLFAPATASAQPPERLSIGMMSLTGPRSIPRHNPAAVAFAQTQGEVTPLTAWANGWTGADRKPHALETFDVVWYHQGDDPHVTLASEAIGDLTAYLKQGGVLLLSGAAGSLLNDLGIESTSLRILGPSGTAYRSGIRVRSAERPHPAFAGLDPTKPILLTGFGGNAMADFYGTPGPHGQLLADGNASSGERPLVEYRLGQGRVMFVGWRLADFTTTDDPYRPNLERLFHNLLHYLAGLNRARATLIVPTAKHRFSRVLGLPFFEAAAPAPFHLSGRREAFAAVLSTKPGGGTDYPVGKLHVSEIPLTGGVLNTTALAVTLFDRPKPVGAAAAALKTELARIAQADQALLQGLTVLKPKVTFQPAPLAPLVQPDVEQSVLLGHSPFMAPGDGLGDMEPVYEPLADGGFRIAGSKRTLNRPVVHGQNRLWTGDVPLFRMDTVTGNGSYARTERVYPLWPRPDAHIGNVNPSMGTLRLGLVAAGGKTVWLDAISDVTATFRPGYTQYAVRDAGRAWTAKVTAAPLLASHGMVCRVGFDPPQRLVWQYGGVWWDAGQPKANAVALRANHAEITEPGLPNNLVLAGWDSPGTARTLVADYGQQAEFTAQAPRAEYAIAAVWGVTRYDEDRTQQTMARLDTPNTAAWPAERDRLKRLWFDCYIGRALQPERRFTALMKDPRAALDETRHWWDERRQEFQITTPDAPLNALVNWERSISEYHRQGPGLVLGGQIWQMYSHISTGWYGKQWAGDHAAIADTLRFYGAMQDPSGFIRWISPSLVAFFAENNTPYWVDQVERHYAWTGDRALVADLWPAVKRAVAWQRAHNDPDGDGLFRDYYEYWNCDSNGKGPKAATPSAMSWRMLTAAADLARVVGDRDAEKEYRRLAHESHAAIFAQLWREEEGLLGSIGADGLWRGHPQTWEQYLAVNAGLLSPDQGRRAMRWLAGHYGFEPRPGVKLLAVSDWWPLRWSCQWVPTGDTCLAVLAGMKCGDAEFWYPWLRTAVGSAFRSSFPGINMGISNFGAGGGDREDVDSVDPYLHVAVRGLFGIEPAIDQGRIDICPALPADWTTAAIRTPDVAYEYRRNGEEVTLRIHTPRPLVKRVRANLAGAEVVTPAETDSVATVRRGQLPPYAGKAPRAPILVDQAKAVRGKACEKCPISSQVLFDLSAVSNTTSEGFVDTRFMFDYADYAQPIRGWWGNPTLALSASPRVLQASGGLRFLTVGRPPVEAGQTPNNVLALASWRPYPWPAGATVEVGFPCRRLWLLWQNYVHPMKNYVPNGEIVLDYADGSRTIESLVPPYNLDCFFQHFALRGEPVPFGQVGGGSFIDAARTFAHADVFPLACNPAKPLRSFTVRATCSEAALGILAVTAEKGL